MTAAAASPQPATGAGFPEGLRYADRLRLAAEARAAAVDGLADGPGVALTSLLGPLGEGPEWPAGPAWRAIRREGRVLIFSDGLSDPWVDRKLPETGLGLEVYVDSPASGLAAGAPLVNAVDTWLFPMIAEVSHLLAGRSTIRSSLLGGGLGSLEFMIDHLKDGLGHRGALLNPGPDGMPATILLPGGQVGLVAVTLLMPSELLYLRRGGSREELARRLRQAGVGHWSLPNREAVA
jgi:hypothetical protein